MTIYKKNINGKAKWQFRCYYTNNDGVRKQKNSKLYLSKKEAKDAEIAFLAVSKENKQIKTLTFGQLSEIWFESWQNDKKYNTIQGKRTSLNKLSVLNELDVYKMTQTDIDRLFDRDDFRSLKTQTKNQILAPLCMIFAFGNKNYDVPNIMDDYPRFKESQEEKLEEMKIWTPEQFESFYQEMLSINDELARLFLVLFWTGLRRNELLSITFDDFDGKSLYIHKQYVNGKWQTLKTNNSIRRIRLDKRTIQAINSQMDKYKDCNGFCSEWFVFGGYKPICARTLSDAKKKACESIGLEPIRVHDFRHSHVSYLIDKGIDIFKISKRLGHSKVSMTLDVYGHLLDRNEDEIINAIEKQDIFKT